MGWAVAVWWYLQPDGNGGGGGGDVSGAALGDVCSWVLETGRW